jgi:uncharacterized protein
MKQFTKIAFTPEVKAAQVKYGSREIYENFSRRGVTEDTLTEKEIEFIRAREDFYLGTINSNGYPYIQFRGGTKGFLKIVDEKTLGFADFKGNLQYLSVGNLQNSDRVFLFLMDYARRRRLKIWGSAKVIDRDAPLLKELIVPNYPAEVERGIIIKVDALDWNCPQHIPVRYSEAEVKEIIAPLEAKIKALEAQLSK